MVVNQRFVDHYFNGRDPIGRVVHSRGKDHAIIGIRCPRGSTSGSARNSTAYMYFAHAQHWNTGMTVHVRTSGDPNAFIPVLRAEVAAIDAALPLSNVRSTGESSWHRAAPRTRLERRGARHIFGILGLALAAVGIYGVIGVLRVAADARDRDSEWRSEPRPVTSSAS